VKKYVSFLLLFILSTRLCAYNDFVIKDPEGYLHYRINLNTREIWKERKKNIWTKEGKLNFSNIDLRDFKIRPNQTFSSSDKILIAIEGTGQLYELNLKGLNFSRIDSTYFRGHNFLSIKFLRNDTLYSLGGSGFWHINNIETFYSPKLHEWELLNTPIHAGPQQINKQFGGYDKKRDIVSVIESPPFYHSSIKDFTYNLYEKKVTSYEWEHKGIINSSLLFQLGVKSLNSIFLDGIYFFIDSGIIILGDPFENKIYVVEKNPIKIPPMAEFSYHNGYLYVYFVDDDFNKKSTKIDSISISQLKLMGATKGKFYLSKHEDFFIEHISGISIVVILFFGLFLWRKKKKIIPQHQKEEKLQKIEELPFRSEEFLKACLEYPKGHEFNSQSLIELMGYSKYGFETQRQFRAKLLNSINSYFKIYHKMHPVIIRKVSPTDRRMSIYSISEEYYENLKKIISFSSNN